MINRINKILKKEFSHGKLMRKIGAGAANIIYLCETEVGRVVIKINLNNEEDLSREFNNMNYVAGQGFNQLPKLISFGEINKKKYIIQEYIPGKILKEGKLTDSQIKKLAEFFKELHKIKRIKTCGDLNNHKKTKFSLTRKFNYIDEILQNYNGCLPKKDYDKYLILFDKAKKFLIKNDKSFIHNQTHVINHGDCNPQNFIFNKDEVFAIDWVYSKFKPEIGDILDLFNKARLTKRQENLFLKHYGKINLKKMKAFSIASYLGMAIWSLDRLIKIKNKKLHRDLYKSKANELRMFKRQVNKLKLVLK